LPASSFAEVQIIDGEAIFTVKIKPISCQDALDRCGDECNYYEREHLMSCVSCEFYMNDPEYAEKVLKRYNSYFDCSMYELIMDKQGD
jgi:hypothetical protein